MVYIDVNMVKKGLPKVSILWVNYNSSKIINVVLDSLKAICELEYPKDEYELIVVDNGSTDGSFEKIKDFLERRGSLRKKIIRLERNLGFTGGNNTAYRARDPDSKYIVLLNNDAVPYPRSLEGLVKFMEENPKIGAAQGIILRLRGDIIENAGWYIDNALNVYGFFEGDDPSLVPRKPYYISYASGAYAIYRVDAVKRAVGPERLFPDITFAYFDDNYLSLKLWSTGYGSAAIPIPAARHVGGATFKQVSLLSHYLGIRNGAALLNITNSRYKKIIWIARIRCLLTNPIISIMKRDSEKLIFSKIYPKALCNGLKLGKTLKLMGEKIDIYRTITIRFGLKELFLMIFSRRKLEKTIKKQLNKTIKEFYI